MAQIVREHYGAVYRFCARRIGPETAQDAAQDTFVTAQKAIRKFKGDSSLLTWLLGIAHNHCRNLARKNNKEIPLCETWVGSELPEDDIVNRDLLRQSLSRLSPEHLEVVVLHELDGLTYDEAATILNVPVGTVKSRLHHAFLKLRSEVKL